MLKFRTKKIILKCNFLRYYIMPQKINMFLTTNKTAITSSTLSSNSMLRNIATSSSSLGNLKHIYMNRNPSCG